MPALSVCRRLHLRISSVSRTSHAQLLWDSNLIYFFFTGHFTSSDIVHLAFISKFPEQLSELNQFSNAFNNLAVLTLVEAPHFGQPEMPTKRTEMCQEQSSSRDQALPCSPGSAATPQSCTLSPAGNPVQSPLARNTEGIRRSTRLQIHLIKGSRNRYAAARKAGSVQPNPKGAPEFPCAVQLLIFHASYHHSFLTSLSNTAIGSCTCLQFSCFNSCIWALKDSFSFCTSCWKKKGNIYSCINRDILYIEIYTHIYILCTYRYTPLKIRCKLYL